MSNTFNKKGMLKRIIDEHIASDDDEEEEKDNGPNDIGGIIQNIIESQLPDYKEGKNEEYYKKTYSELYKNVIEKEKKDNPVKTKGGKTQKRKKRTRPKQHTIKNKV